MDFGRLQNWLGSQIEDFAGEIAYRTAFRALLQVSGDLRSTRASKKQETSRIIALLRSLITNQVYLDQQSVELRPFIERAEISLAAYAVSSDPICRSTRSSLQITHISNESSQLEYLRRTLQAAKDGSINLKNKYRRSDSRFYDVDIWALIERDLHNIDEDGAFLLPIFIENDKEYLNSWITLQEHLIFFDDGWDIWLDWIRFRLFSETNGLIPIDLWPSIEERLVKIDYNIWDSYSRLNAEFRSIVDSCIDVYNTPVDIEEQNPLAAQFVFNTAGKVDVKEEAANNQPINEIIKQELFDAIHNLDERCSANSSAALKNKIAKYKTTLKGEDRASRTLLVVRGDGLRTELKYQINRDFDSDVPPLTQAVIAGLEEVVAAHNLFVNSDNLLAATDRMLLDPDVKIDAVPLSAAHTLVHSRETEHLLSDDTKALLDEVISGSPADPITEDRRYRRVVETIRNLVRVILSALYEHKGKVAATTAAIPPALYGLGKWAIANQAILEGYFRYNPAMLHVVRNIMEWLHSLPLL